MCNALSTCKHSRRRNDRSLGIIVPFAVPVVVEVGFRDETTRAGNINIVHGLLAPKRRVDGSDVLGGGRRRGSHGLGWQNFEGWRIFVKI